MNRLVGALLALAAGAAAMYYFDPASGRRRRAHARQRLAALGRGLAARAAAQTRYAGDRVRGALAGVRLQAPDSDRQLHDRVRARLGHLVDDAHAVITEVERGCVRLRGSVRTRELQRLIAELSRLPGVERVDSRLVARSETLPH